MRRVLSWVLLAQKVTHESTKVYSITGSEAEVWDALGIVIGLLSILSYSDFDVVNEGDGILYSCNKK